MHRNYSQSLALAIFLKDLDWLRICRFNAIFLDIYIDWFGLWMFIRKLNNSYESIFNSKWQETPGESWIINNSISSLLASHIYAYWASRWVSKESGCVCLCLCVCMCVFVKEARLYRANFRLSSEHLLLCQPDNLHIPLVSYLEHSSARVNLSNTLFLRTISSGVLKDWFLMIVCLLYYYILCKWIFPNNFFNTFTN